MSSSHLFCNLIILLIYHVISSVSESTAQFLMAEKLTSTALAEDEILAAMGSVQPARQPLLLNTAPRPGMGALSIEEEKIFQSLDRLNRRLQSKFNNKKNPTSSD